jgi:hypothetical protein
MRILENRDRHLDFCKAVLVVMMVIIHAVQNFWVNHYNMHLTYFVTIGFVFLTNFIASVLIERKIEDKNYIKDSRLIARSVKLFCLFIILNIFGLIIFEERRFSIGAYGAGKLCKDIFLFNRQDLFAFDILVVLSLTYLILILLRRIWTHWFCIFICLLVIFQILFLFEAVNLFNHYGPKLVLAGLVGGLLGKTAVQVEWDYAISFVKENNVFAVWLVIISAAFFFTFSFVPENTSLQVFVHLPFTVIVLATLYSYSIITEKYSFKIVLWVFEILSRHMLLIYIFHIILIKSITTITNPKICNGYQTLILTCLAVILSFILAWTVEYLNGKSPIVKRIYSLALK